MNQTQENNTYKSYKSISEIDPAVIIGIGGVGKEILMRIRRMIVERYGSLKNVPQIQFMHVDTHNQIEPEHAKQTVMGEDIRFTPEERIELSEKIKTNLLGDPNVKTWFPDPLAKNISQITFTEGAGGIRAYGRFAFHCGVGEFIEVLNAKARRAHSNSRGSDKVTVYIVCSFFGGTGSGSFLDVCYNIQEKNTVPGLGQVLGFFVIGGDGIKQPEQANCYAALKELEYYSTCGKVNQPGFRVDYPGKQSGTGIHNNRPPVDTCYLIDWINAQGVQFSREQLEENVARRIFLEFHDDVGDRISGKRVDIRGKTPNFDRPDGLLKRAQNFLSFGLSIIEFPAITISDTLAYGLAEDCTKFWLFDDAELNPTLEEEVMQFIKDNDLEEDALIGDLSSGTGGHPIAMTINQRIISQINAINGEIERKPFNGKSIKITIDNSLATYDGDLQYNPDPNKRGTYLKTIYTNKDITLNKLLKTIDAKVNDMMSNSFEGVKNAEKFLSSLITRMESQRKNVQNKIEIYRTNKSTASNRRTRQYSKLTNDLEEKFRWELKQHAKRLYNYTRTYLINGCSELAYEAAEDLLKTLIQDLEDYQKKCERFRTRLGELGGKFKAKKEERKQVLLSPDDQAKTQQVRITEEDLKSIDQNNVPHRKRTAIDILAEIQSELGEKDLEGKPVKPLPILQTVEHKDFEQEIEKKCTRRYDNVKNISVTNELVRRGMLKNARGIIDYHLKRSKVMLRASLDDQTIAYSPDASHKKFIFYADDKEFDQVKGLLPGMHELYPILSKKYQIIFTEELGGFPLRSVDVLKEIYQTVYKTTAKRAVLHTDKRVEFEDIFPFDPKIEQIQDRAHRARVLGEMLELLKLHPAEDGYEKIFLFVSQDRIKPLAETWELAEEELWKEQIDKDVEQEIDIQTRLEILEEDLESIGTRADTRGKREELRDKTQKYLDQLLEKQDSAIGKASIEYQDHLEIINAFRNQYKLQS